MISERSGNILFNQFLYWVERTPNKKAIVYKKITLTYKEFERKISTLAVHIKRKYSHLVTGNQNSPIFIGVMCHSKLYTLCCEFSILALGASFVPFSFSDATDRQKFMMDKTQLSLILTDEPANDSPLYCNITSVLDESPTERVTFPSDIYSTQNMASDIAYVLFTSGSTAQNPKGVIRSQSSLFNQITRDYKSDLQITEKDCVCNLAIATHDQFIVDCYNLLNGVTLCLYDPHNLNVLRFHDFMQKNKVTIFSSIPSMFKVIFQHIPDKSTFPSLRIVAIGGEETFLKHAELYQETCPRTCTLVNGYGATEISWVSFFNITHQTDLKQLKEIPLGYLTKSAKLKLIPLDSEENDSSEQLYELCIASDSLSSGYLNDQEATSQAFFVEEGNRYYRTGDIVILDDNQCLHFKGRKVWHEKINGKRVNLHEIENTLNNYFKDCVVITHGEEEQKKLYAFYSSLAKSQPLPEIMLQLKKILEPHMIPYLEQIDNFPTLANGKINRQALRKKIENTIAINEEYREKINKLKRSNDIFKAVEGFWRDILEIPFDVELDKNHTFQNLGGNSQLAIMLAQRINRYFKENHSIDIIIEPNKLYKEERFFIKFSNYVNGLFYEEKQETSPLLKPSCQAKRVVLIYHAERWTGYYDFDNPKKITVVEYNFDGLKIVTDYFNELHKIKIVLCETKSAIIGEIHNFNNNIHNKNTPHQIGLIFFLENKKKGHPIASILCKDTINNKTIMLIADGTQGFSSVGKALVNIAKIKEHFPELDIRFDLTGRQVDLNSCLTDAVLYLVAALQCDMLKESTFLNTTTLADADKAIPYRYLDGIKDQCALSKLESCSLFISPIQTFYHSQVLSIYEIYKVTPAEKVDGLLGQLGKEAIITKNSVDCFFTEDTYNPNDSKTRKYVCNTILWKKSYEFKDIIDAVMQNKTQALEITSSATNGKSISVQIGNAVSIFPLPTPPQVPDRDAKKEQIRKF